MLTYFRLAFATAINGILTQWSSLMFFWILADASAVTSLGTFVSFIVFLSLSTIPSVIKPLFYNCSPEVDFFIVSASVLAWGTGVLYMALAPTREMLVAAVVVGNFGAGTYDALKGMLRGNLGVKMRLRNFIWDWGLLRLWVVW